ncbi:hypothetical protein [Bowmanella denitrificans]|uniref:hypothetical protein n=1 Tax=Bowmanella denitrificans TaxID=366582 RepID=UPI000C9A9253|nr:hypothetical protein [Bowmanella denitrificans]
MSIKTTTQRQDIFSPTGDDLAAPIPPEQALQLANITIEDQSRLIGRLREALQHIYAMRGEDELIASVCNPLIDQTRYY